MAAYRSKTFHIVIERGSDYQRPFHLVDSLTGQRKSLAGYKAELRIFEQGKISTDPTAIRYSSEDPGSLNAGIYVQGEAVTVFLPDSVTSGVVWESGNYEIYLIPPTGRKFKFQEGLFSLFGQVGGTAGGDIPFVAPENATFPARAQVEHLVLEGDEELLKTYSVLDSVSGLPIDVSTYLAEIQFIPEYGGYNTNDIRVYSSETWGNGYGLNLSDQTDPGKVTVKIPFAHFVGFGWTKGHYDLYVMRPNLTGKVKIAEGFVTILETNYAGGIPSLPPDSGGCVPISAGGTGATTPQGAINNLTSATPAKQGYLLSVDASGNATYLPAWEVSATVMKRFVFNKPTLVWTILHNQNTTRYKTTIRNQDGNVIVAKERLISENEFEIIFTSAVAGSVDVIFDTANVPEVTVVN